MPDGFRRGEPFRLYTWQWRWYVNYYLVRGDFEQDHANPILGPAYVNRFGLLIGPQGIGKNPIIATQTCLEGVGPSLVLDWAGKDDGYACADWGCSCGWEYAYEPGEPMGMVRPTSLIQITAFSEDSPLALDTPVPTPGGWSTVGGIHAGDQVFTPEGRVVTVARESRVIHDAECLEVEFSDGERVVASREHLWTLELRGRHDSTYESVTLSTGELDDNLRTSRGGLRLRQPMPGAWVLPEADLPVDPYILGLWLGDGSKRDATIACDARLRSDVERILHPLLRWYEDLVWHEGPGNQATVRIRRRKGLCARGHEYRGDLVHGTCGECRRTAGRTRRPRPLATLRERLRDVGVLGSKHIPVAYLRASEPQRRALLQGLVDSDGHVHPNGLASFANKDPRLIEGITELLTSLGMQWRHRRHGDAAGNVFFVPTSEHPAARLPHKLARHRTGSRKRLSAYRFVTGVRPVASVSVKCIGIDTDDHLFLVGRRAVATHNTGNTYDALRPMIALGPLAHVMPHRGEEFIRLPNDGRIDTVTSSNRSRLGQRLTWAPQDELGLWTPEAKMVGLFDTQQRNASKMGGRTAGTSNAWDPAERSVAKREWESGSRDVYRQMTEPPANLSFANKVERRKIYQVVYEPETLRENGGHVDLDSIDAQAVDLINKGEIAQAARFYGNIRMPGAGKAVDIERWNALGRPRGPAGDWPDGMPPQGTQIGLGFDGSIRWDATSLRGCTADGYRFDIAKWVRPSGRDMLLWQAEHPGEEWRVPRDEVHSAVLWALHQFRVGRFLGDPSKWHTEMGEWAEWFGADVDGKPIVIPYDPERATLYARAFDRWLVAIAEGTALHDGDPVTAEHVAALHKKKVRLRDDDGDQTSYVPTKGEDKKPIDCAMADILANEAAMTMPPPEEPSVYESRGFLVLRQAQLSCPECYSDVLAERRTPEPTGWRCPQAEGGCGLTFDPDDPRIVDQLEEPE